jgi:hypothetical protein
LKFATLVDKFVHFSLKLSNFALSKAILLKATSLQSLVSWQMEHSVISLSLKILFFCLKVGLPDKI